MSNTHSVHAVVMTESAIWINEIDNYLLTLICAGRPPTTVDLRRKQLVNMGKGIGIDPASVTGDDLIAWMGTQQWRVETRRSYRAAARGFYAWQHSTGRIDHNPATALPPIREERGLPRPAPDHVYRAAMLAAPPHIALMLRLAAETGLRRGEISRIHVRDLQDGPSLLVHGKGSKDRVVPITEDLAATIRARAGTGWLFPGHDNGHLSPDWLGVLCTKVLPDHWTLHTLRHRFATRAYRASHDLRAVQILLGHESVATTQRYLAVDDDQLRTAMVGAVA